MISRKELLGIIYTEAVEYGGVQEIPVRTDGAKQSYHSPKRISRGPETIFGKNTDLNAEIACRLQVVKQADGTLDWED